MVFVDQMSQLQGDIEAVPRSCFTGTSEGLKLGILTSRELAARFNATRHFCKAIPSLHCQTYADAEAARQQQALELTKLTHGRDSSDH